MKNILIIGGKGTLRDELTHKLSREGNHVYLLSNGKKKAGASREYFYAYDSDSVREALDSSNPNTIVFLGAYDPAFTWSVRTEQKDYKAYVSGLTNILHWAEAAGVHRFVYISSECVFEDHYLSPISEEMAPTPRSTKGIAVSLGESIVNSYASHQRMDVVVVRMAHLYMTPQNARECTDIYTRLCLQAASRGRMEINAKIHRSALYLGDGVQALLLLLAASSHNQPLYHITAATSCTEDQVAALIQSSCSRAASIEDRTTGMEHSILLSDHYFADEFAFTILHDLDETIPKIMKQIQGNLRQYTAAADDESAENKSHFMRILHRLIPFIEALIVFALVVLAEMHLSDSEFFIHVDFFMLYVLLFALFHGLHQSIFTSALSVIGYFITRLGASSSLEILMDVGTYVWIAQIFIMGMSVGHLKDRLLQLQSDKDDEINYLALRLGDISDINKSNVTIKNYFEQQTINSTESLGYFYDIVAQLDAANENELLFVAVQLLARIMGTEDVAIYSIGSAGYFRLLASMSKNASAAGKSLHANNYTSVFKALEKEHIFINRQMDDRLPLMASGIYNQAGELNFVIFLWNLPYERMTLHYSNTLRIVSLLIRSAVERTAHYLNALTKERYYKNTDILQDAAFRDICSVYENARQKELTDYTLLRIDCNETPFAKLKKKNKEDKKQKKADVMLKMDQLLQGQLRQADYVGYLNDNAFYVLLTNTDTPGSQVVIRRLKENQVHSYPVEKLPS